MIDDSFSGQKERFQFDRPFDIVYPMFRFEPPDIFVVCPSRPPTSEETAVLLTFLHEARDRMGGVFALFTLSDESRRLGASDALEMNRMVSKGMVKATAIIGTSFHTRVETDIQRRAARSLKLDVANVLVELFPDETQARAWFDELRAANA